MARAFAKALLLGALAFCALSRAGLRPERSLLVPDCAPGILTGGGSDKEVAEYGLQLFRMAVTPEARDAASRVFVPSTMRIVNNYFLRYGVYDAETRDDLVQETLLAVVRQIDRLRAGNEFRRYYFSIVWVTARHDLLHHWRTERRRHFFPMGKLSNAVESPPAPTFIERPAGESTPIPLSARQLAIFRRIARGQRYADIAAELDISVRQISDSLGNLETKLGNRFQDPGIRRTHIAFLPDLLASHRVFIHLRRNETVAIVGEGPVPIAAGEAERLVAWIRGDDEADHSVTGPEARRQLLHGLVERRHDFAEAFGKTRFVRELDVQVSESEGQYALFRAYGFGRGEIMALLGAPKPRVMAWHDRLQRRLKALLEPQNIQVDLRRPYYAAVEARRDVVHLIFNATGGGRYLVRCKVVDRAGREYRQTQSDVIALPRAAVLSELDRMDANTAAPLRLRLLEDLTTPQIAERLGYGISTIRKNLAEATFRLGVVFDKPELNCWNLRLKE